LKVLKLLGFARLWVVFLDVPTFCKLILDKKGVWDFDLHTRLSLLHFSNALIRRHFKMLPFHLMQGIGSFFCPFI